MRAKSIFFLSLFTPFATVCLFRISNTIHFYTIRIMHIIRNANKKKKKEEERKNKKRKNTFIKMYTQNSNGEVNNGIILRRRIKYSIDGEM